LQKEPDNLRTIIITFIFVAAGAIILATVLDPRARFYRISRSSKQL